VGTHGGGAHRGRPVTPGGSEQTTPHLGPLAHGVDAVVVQRPPLPEVGVRLRLFGDAGVLVLQRPQRPAHDVVGNGHLDGDLGAGVHVRIVVFGTHRRVRTLAQQVLVKFHVSGG